MSLVKNVRKTDISDKVIAGMLIILGLLCVFPFYNTFILSFAKYESVIVHTPYVLPYSFDTYYYKLLFMGKTVTNSFLLTVFITVTGSLFSMILTMAAAYGLSKKDVPGRNIMLGFIVFTMFFSGGLIPNYLLAVRLHLVNNILIYILKGAIGTYYLIIMKNYFNTVPASLEESAKIDGADDIYILWKIVIPVSAPIIATISLFYAVDKWNDWYTAFIYINNPKLFPLQNVLRKMVVEMTNTLDSEMASAMRLNKKPVYPPGIRMAIVVVTALPILLVYPFLQKYFTKGILIGSIKS